MLAAIKPPVAAYPSELFHQLWSRDLAREHAFEPLEVEGTIPPSLRGTLFRNGPGQFGQFGRRYSHPFEADGATTAIRLAHGAAEGASKIHDTAGLARERAAGKQLYGLALPWHKRVANALRGRDKNTANTNVMVWQGRVFALMEAGKPTEIDAQDLSTIGETDLGAITTGFFSAHPHRVAARSATYNFGLEYGRVTKLHTYELPDVGAARRLGTVELKAPPMLHDFIATDTHLVFFVSPSVVDVPRMLLQVGGMDKMFRWKPELGTEVICVPIDRPHEVLRFTVDAFYQWHFANAYGRANELVVEYVRYPNFDSFHELGAQLHGATGAVFERGIYHRATIDLAARTLRSEPLSDRPCEFPTVAPGSEGNPHALAYGVFDEQRAVGSIDGRGTVVSHTLPDGELASEPLYAGGYLLSLCHAPDRAYLAIYDAARIPDGPVARAWLDHHVPITFHGTWYER